MQTNEKEKGIVGGAKVETFINRTQIKVGMYADKSSLIHSLTCG